MITITSTKALSRQIDKAVSEAIPPELRAHRKLDLDRPIRLDPRPIIELKDAVIKTALKKLFTDSRFCIIDFDKIADLAGVYPPKGLRELLSPLHCVRWSEMEPDLRDQVQQHILALVVPVEKQEEDA